MKKQVRLCLLAGMLWLQLCGVSVGEPTPYWDPVNPHGRKVTSEEIGAEWNFENGPDEWQAIHHSRVSAEAGRLLVTSTGKDPYLHGPGIRVDGRIQVEIRMKGTAAGRGQVFWTTTSGSWSEKRSTPFTRAADGEWHTYTVPVKAEEPVTRLRLDPATGKGEIVVDYIRLHCTELHPLEIVRVEQAEQKVVATVKNHAEEPVTFTLAGRSHDVRPAEKTQAAVSTKGDAPFASVSLRLKHSVLPTLSRTVYLHRPRKQADWIHLSQGNVTVRCAPDGSGARILQNGQRAAVLAPLLELNPLERDRTIPRMELVKKEENRIVFTGDDFTKLSLTLSRRKLFYQAEAPAPVAGPVVRVKGHMQQGLLSGVEYLGEGERSSSRRDIRTAEHVRFTPGHFEVTMPLMAYVIDRARLALSWRNMDHQPFFATPNVVDGTDEHLMGLAGKDVNATLRIAPGWKNGGRLRDCILWKVRQNGLPHPPDRPRHPTEQRKLSLSAYRKALKGAEGWRTLVRKGEARWYADYASAVWRLSGSAPETGRLTPGGSHLPLPEIFFLTGEVERWLTHIRKKARQARRSQRADGSWSFEGELAETHYENTASGLCATRALPLLRHAWLTGNQESRRAGIRALEFMKKFRTPRGAQTWEIPLHTPDIMASARLIQCYVLGYRLTAREDFLRKARNWAITGLSFIYMWSERPVMLYATIPVLGATHYERPNWIGRPVQWCGTVYADALLALAPLDETLDWEKVARGITVAGEQMQYTEGEPKGTLPDSWLLYTQEPRPWDIDPGALVSLRRRLEGRPAGVYTVASEDHRIVSPYPVTLEDDTAVIEAEEEVTYRVLIAGERVEEVHSNGRDRIALDGSGKE